MQSQHLGSCLGCGRSVFGPPGTLYGSFPPHNCNCSCLKKWKGDREAFLDAEVLLHFANGKGMPAYDLVMETITVFGKPVLLTYLRRGTENVLVGHIEA